MTETTQASAVGASTVVRDLAQSTGEYSLTVDGPLGEQRVRFWGDVPAAPAPMVEPALATALLPAMTMGGELSIPEQPNPHLRRALPDLQAALQSIAIASPHVDRPLEIVEVTARSEGSEMRAEPAPGRVGLFFSGGVDSWATLLSEPRITDLFYVHGFDIPIDHPEASEVAERRLGEVAQRRGLGIHVVRTDARVLLDPMIGWEIAFGPMLAAVAMLFAPLFERILFASGVTYAEPVAHGSHPLVDHFWSTESCRIENQGSHLTRTAKIEQLAECPEALEVLRVCWRNVDEYNCGRCEKCLRTMVALEATGALGQCATFSAPLDLDAIARLRLDGSEQLTWWAENSRLARRRGRPELVEALEICLSSNERRIATQGSAELGAQLAAAKLEVEALSRRLDTVLSSRSWRFSAPLRKAGAGARALGRRWRAPR